MSGAAATTKGGRGALLVMDKNDLAGEVVARWEVAATPVKVVWHSKINQVRSIGIMYRIVITKGDTWCRS